MEWTFEKTESKIDRYNFWSSLYFLKDLQGYTMPSDLEFWFTSCSGNDSYLPENGRIHVRRLKVQVQTLPLGGP